MALLKEDENNPNRKKKVTSIGANTRRSIPKNKRKRRCWKPYRGQGR